MKRQSSIEIKRFTNFLRAGAFVRRQGVWTLLSEPIENANLAAISTIRVDYLTSEILRIYYKNQWDMGSAEFYRILEMVARQLQEDREKIIIDWQDVDKLSFTESFERAQAAFKAGEVKKVVPIAVQKGRLKSTLSVSQKLSLLRNLAATPVHLYAYGEWADDAGFMGATPEVLFEKTQLRIETMALAGTSGKDVKVADFFNDPKERKEHQYVVDDITETLRSIGAVHVGDTNVVEFPALNHLQTPISAELKIVMTTDALIRKMHPTPALGIYPRNDYFNTFRQYPLQNERGFFGAPWGIESNETAFLLVAIRKWDWNQRNIHIFAGCGVVQESRLEKEFAEILKKIDSVKKIFFQD